MPVFCEPVVSLRSSRPIPTEAWLSYLPNATGSKDTVLTAQLMQWLNKFFVLRVVGSIPAWKKYLYDLQIVVLCLGVCTCDIYERKPV